MGQLSLFGDLSRPDKQSDIELVKKSNSKKKKAPTVKGGSITSKIKIIRENVENALGKYKDRYICIQDMNTLRKYVDVCLKDDRIALDTETTGLNVFRDKIVGICLKSKSNKGAYIPINHVSYNIADNTFTRIDTQLTEEQIKPELIRLAENIKEVDMFNL